MLTFSMISSAWAQDREPGFFEEYINIAKLFDSPVFFAIVVGSGMLLLTAALIFLSYIKKYEKRVAEWGQAKSVDELIELLQLYGMPEGQMAFAYLRKHSGEETIPKLIESLKAQRKAGQMNPYVFYLLEDLKALDALPLMEQIASGKSRVSGLAQRAAESLKQAKKEQDEQANKKQAEAKA